jgi:hypothetical protein
MDDWALGRMDDWALGRMDDWALGRMDDWALGRIERQARKRFLYSVVLPLRVRNDIVYSPFLQALAKDRAETSKKPHARP